MAAPIPPWAKKSVLNDAPKVLPSVASNSDPNPEARSSSSGLDRSGESVLNIPGHGATNGASGPVAVGWNGSVPTPPSWAPKLGGNQDSPVPPGVVAPDSTSGVVLPSFLTKPGSYSPPSRPYVGRKVARGNGRNNRLDKDDVKSRVLGNVRSYYDLLFGKGSKAGTSIQYKCPFHDDRSPSLSVSIATGGWKCHAASCGESGDIFSAWEKKKGSNFLTALREIAEWAGDPALQPRRTITEAIARGGSVEITNGSILRTLKTSQDKILTNEPVLAKLKDHYGVTRESVVRFGLGFDRKSYRLWIPVLHRGKVVAVRKHDIMRAHCVWVNEDRSIVKSKHEAATSVVP